jgi:hypothetical protein
MNRSSFAKNFAEVKCVPFNLLKMPKYLRASATSWINYRQFARVPVDLYSTILIINRG